MGGILNMKIHSNKMQDMYFFLKRNVLDLNSCIMFFMLWTIAIVTYNEELNITRLLNSLLRCKRIEFCELLIIDSTSTDGTISKITQIAKKFKNLKIIAISHDEFNYGITRNIAVDKADGEYICFISADAIINEKNFIQFFSEDLGVSSKNIAVFGREIVPANIPYNYFVKEHNDWFSRYRDFFDHKKRVIFNKKNRLLSANFDDKVFWYSLSNVFSCYKRNFLIAHPFQTIYHGEDVLMGKQIMDLGYTKIYDSRCQVVHFHEGLSNYIKRNIDDWYFRLFVIKSGLKINLLSKISKVNNVSKAISLKEKAIVYFFYLIKGYVLIVVIFLRLKHLVMMRLSKQKRREYIRKYI